MQIKLFLQLLLINSSFAATFILSDNLASDGSGVITGNSPLVEGAGVYNASSGNAGNPSGYNALMVGASYGNTGSVWRTVLTFDVSGLDLSGLPAPTPGFAYAVTDVSVTLEQSGDRPAATINFFEGSQPTGAVVNYLATQNYSANQSGQFQTTSLGITNLDLSTDPTFTVTMDAPNASSGAYHTFGSGLAPNNIGITGTNSVALAPQLTIEYELVAIPEPSSFALGSLGLLGLIARRKR